MLNAAVEALPIRIDLERLINFCRVNNIQELALFGSVLREDFTDKSDIDVLATFFPGTRLSLFKLSDFETDLATILDQDNPERPVDLKLPTEISPKLFPRINAQKRVLYVAS